MIGSPPAPTGQLSPDGRWRWDGTRWLPVQPQRKSHRRVWIWSAVGCLTLILLTAGGTGYWIYTLWQGLKNGTTTCVPSDFPRYPGAKFGAWSYDLNGPYGVCHATFESTDDVVTVAAYYQGKMNGGDWQVTLFDDQSSTVIFESAHGSAPYGTVQVASKDAGSEITLDLYSEVCHLQGFPAYPGGKFGGQSTGAGGYGCHVVWLTNDRMSAVIAFYKSKLSRGNWRVVSSSDTQVAFQLKNGIRVDASGTVTVGPTADGRTQITIESSP